MEYEHNTSHLSNNGLITGGDIGPVDKGAHVIVSGVGRVRVGCRTLCNYKDVLLNYFVKYCNPVFLNFFGTNDPPAFHPVCQHLMIAIC